MFSSKGTLLIIAYFSVFFVAAQPQKTLGVNLLSSSSPLGNYIQIINKNDLANASKMADIDHFVIKRCIATNGLDPASLSIYSEQLKTVGVVKRFPTTKEIKQVLDQKGLDDWKMYMGFKTDLELERFIASVKKADDFGIPYVIVEVRMAIGHTYLDKDVEQGILYYYKVFAVNKQKEERYWGSTFTIGKAGNYRLPFLQPKSAGVKVADSGVTFKWSIPIKILSSPMLPLPTKRFPFDSVGKLYKTFFSAGMLRASVATKTNEGSWESWPTIMQPVLNKTKDTLHVTIVKKAEPGSVVQAKLVMEDDIHNKGKESDTAIAFIVTQKNATKLTEFKVQDTLNGLLLSWKAIPASPYLAGVQIIRYTNVQQGDTLPLVPLTDTAFLDHTTKAGVNYRYEARVLYLPGVQFYQDLPATNFGTPTKFNRPTPPYELTAQTEGRHIRLNWKAAEDPTIAEYFVYRGTSPSKLSLMPGRKTSTTFLDTSISLSGGSTYYYAVVSQNLMQDTSVYSNIVAIIPKRGIEIHPPTSIQFYYSNGTLHLTWQDARQNDNRVEKFIVQRKSQTDSNFVWLTKQPIVAPTTTDANIKAGQTIQYRVASISYKGDTSALSEIAQFVLPNPNTDVLNKFYVSATPNGIAIALPNAIISNRKAYNIYRRTLQEPDFKKIASIAANQFEYIDTKVEKGETYVYAISITDMQDQEGILGNSANTIF